jgi:hypothetical protein
MKFTKINLKKFFQISRNKMALPKFDFKKVMEEIDAKWTSLILGLLSLVYFVGKSFLQLFTSLYGWIIIAFAIAIIVSPEVNKFVKTKIMKVIDKFRKRAPIAGNTSNRSSDGPMLGNLFE